MELPKVTAPKIDVSLVQFLKETKIELKKVKWPSKDEVVRLTLIVIAVSAGVSLFISALDFIFTKLTQLFVQ